jgi:hypothetical protein
VPVRATPHADPRLVMDTTQRRRMRLTVAGARPAPTLTPAVRAGPPCRRHRDNDRRRIGALAVAAPCCSGRRTPACGRTSRSATGWIRVGSRGRAVWVLYALPVARGCSATGGHATLTCLPFIAAATIWRTRRRCVGGRARHPDLRSTRAPWYGVLASHASLILAARRAHVPGTVGVAERSGSANLVVLLVGGLPARPSAIVSALLAAGSSSCATASSRRTRRS